MLENTPSEKQTPASSSTKQSSIRHPSTVKKTDLSNLSDSPAISAGIDSEKVRQDVGLMLNYAINTGKELPNNIVLTPNMTDSSLISNYNNLRKIIAPATVESIKYINSQMMIGEKHKHWYKIPIFSKCVIIAAISLLAMILISLSPQVDDSNMAKGLLENSGISLLYNLIFICSASLLGVMFYLLKTFGNKIQNYTLVPANAIELNASILIGLISGFIISELFSFSIDKIDNDYVEIQKMTLALLGGFSSDAIFSTLEGIVNKFKKIVSS